MEKLILSDDVIVFYVAAQTYPGGIAEAFQKLQQLHPSIGERPFYGISHEKKTGGVSYKAAVKEAFIGEGKKYGCEIFVIKKGEYLVKTVFNFMNSIYSIPEAFLDLTGDKRFDKNYPCIEWYKSSKEIMCMVRLHQ